MTITSGIHAFNGHSCFRLCCHPERRVAHIRLLLANVGYQELPSEVSAIAFAPALVLPLLFFAFDFGCHPERSEGPPRRSNLKCFPPGFSAQVRALRVDRIARYGSATTHNHPTLH